MACYIISYDLVRERDYTKLTTAIKAYGTWAHIHESVWAVVTATTAAQVRDNLIRFLDSDDRIFVVRSGTEAAWRGVLCTTEWLQKNL
jgi:hypothetical protein